MDEKSLDYKTAKRIAVICSGLSLTAVVALIALPRSDTSRCAGVCFALALASLAGFLIMLRTRTKRQRRSLGFAVPALGVAGLLGIIIGITLLFSIISPIAAWVFGIVSFVVGAMYIATLFMRKKA